MTSRQTYFNDQWLDFQKYPEHAGWLEKVNNVSFKCLVCSDGPGGMKSKVVKMSNMGYRAVSSHFNLLNHKKNIEKSKSLKDPPISVFFKKNSATIDGNERENKFKLSDPSTFSSNTTSLRDTEAKYMEKFVTKDGITKAEILWSLHIVAHHQSYNSCEGISKLFQAMFPDCPTAKQLQLSKSKIAYLIPFGLAPYFKSQLMEKIRKSTNYVVCFAEAFNRVSQKSQMDIVIR